MKKRAASEPGQGRQRDDVRGPARGNCAPLGATPGSAGVNFSVFTRHAQAVELLLFDGVDDARPVRIVRMDPSTNRTCHYWHVFVHPSAARHQLRYLVTTIAQPVA